MDIQRYKDIFSQRRNYSIGVEEEFMICDPSSGELINKADEIINQVESNDRYSYELLLSEIETNTPISEDVNVAVMHLSEQRKELRDIGKKNGYRLGVSGTHPNASPLDQKFVANDSYNWVSDQLKYYALRNITFSTHIHISVDDPDRAIRVTNATRRWIPALLALSSNSPFFEGENTGFRSSRSMQFGAFPRTNIPVKIESFESYVNLVKTLIDTESIMKSRQVWWKIRPHLDYGTLEYRICDVQRSLSRTKMLIALVQALVHSYDNKVKCNRNLEDMNYELLNDGFWKACRFDFNAMITDSFDGQKISMKDYIYKMIDNIMPSLIELGNADVIKTLDDIIKNGTEADRQMTVFKENGMNGLMSFLMDDVEYDYKEENPNE